MLSVFGHPSSFKDQFTLVLQSGEGVRMVYSCIGYGVMSFWAAFVLANRGRWKKKVLWILCGWLALWFINVLRMAFLLLAAKKQWVVPFGWDHHTWFNIAAYALIFALIYFYDRSFQQSITNKTANQNIQALS